MDYVAYNENKCSQQSVLDYIIYLILREKEPQMVEVSTVLVIYKACPLTVTKTGQSKVYIVCCNLLSTKWLTLLPTTS